MTDECGPEKLRGGRMIRKVQMERFKVISSKPFDDIVAALKAAIGHPNMADFSK
jgi:hypothetical protein